MKCLFYFGISSMKEGTSAQLSGRGELHGGARVTTLVTLRKCTSGFKREIKILNLVLASTKGFSGGLGLDQALQEKHGSDFFLLLIVWIGFFSLQTQDCSLECSVVRKPSIDLAADAAHWITKKV